MLNCRYSTTSTIVYNLICLEISTTFSSSFIFSKFNVGYSIFLRNKNSSNFLCKWLQIAPILLIFLKIFQGGLTAPPQTPQLLRLALLATPPFKRGASDIPLPPPRKNEMTPLSINSEGVKQTQKNTLNFRNYPTHRTPKDYTAC